MVHKGCKDIMTALVKGTAVKTQFGGDSFVSGALVAAQTRAKTRCR
jgi:hypothetical protein